MRPHLIALAIIATACGRSCGSDPGAECTTQADCGGGLACIVSGVGRSQCMSSCDDETHVCRDGAVCLEGLCGERVCWFGGLTPRGAPCARDLECEAGTVCFEGVCTQACQLERPSYIEGNFDPDEVCFDGEECHAVVAGSVAGVCEPEPVDAGVADAGPSEDAGPREDAGREDAGARGEDAGQSFDAGPIVCAVDAGVTSP